MSINIDLWSNSQLVKYMRDNIRIKRKKDVISYFGHCLKNIISQIIMRDTTSIVSKQLLSSQKLKIFIKQICDGLIPDDNPVIFSIPAQYKCSDFEHGLLTLLMSLHQENNISKYCEHTMELLRLINLYMINCVVDNDNINTYFEWEGVFREYFDCACTRVDLIECYDNINNYPDIIGLLKDIYEREQQDNDNIQDNNVPNNNNDNLYPILADCLEDQYNQLINIPKNIIFRDQSYKNILTTQLDQMIKHLRNNNKQYTNNNITMDDNLHTRRCYVVYGLWQRIKQTG